MLLSQKELAELLGIAKETLWRWRKSGNFPPPIVKRNRYVRWRVADVANWLNLTDEEVCQQIRSLRQEKSAGVGSTGTNDKSVTIKGQTNAKIQ